MKFKEFVNQLSECEISKFCSMKLLQLTTLTVNIVLRHTVVNIVYDIFRLVRKISKSDY